MPWADRVQFHEVPEEEVLYVHEHVHKETDYEYRIEDGKIVVKDYLAWYKSDEVQKGMKEQNARREEGVKKAPRL